MIAHPPGVLIAVFAILLFHGSVYALVALNLGWRFGYWVTAASFFGLFTILASFWVVSALGPRGPEPSWVPIGAAQDNISQAEVNGTTVTAVSTYPGGGWQEPAKDDAKLSADRDVFKSAIGNCVDADPTLLSKEEGKVCGLAQTLLPKTADLPRIDGLPVALVKDLSDIRFIDEGGTLLAEATVRPITKDPRLTSDPNGKLVGKPFKIAAYRDPGSLRLPALKYLLFSILGLILHLIGLSRAEKRVLSPAVAL